MTNVIDVQDISVTLGGMSLFHDASLSVEEGKTYALIGPNGSGKSVLLKTICGFVTPISGHVWIEPRYLARRRTFPEGFGITIDGPAYLPGRTGLENLLELARIRRQIGLREVKAAMIRVGLDPDNRQKARNYSLGMKQKLSLAQAFMERPDVLVLDEPFNALDKESVANTKKILAEEKERGATILFTSHSDTDVEDLSDYIYAVRDRRLEPV